MRKILGSALVALLCVGAAHAQVQAPVTPGYTTNGNNYIAVSPSNPLPVTTSAPSGGLDVNVKAFAGTTLVPGTAPLPVGFYGSNGVLLDPTQPQQVVGNVAAGTPDSGNSAKFGCVNNTTLPTYSNGNRTDCQADIRGGIYVAIKGKDGTVFATVGAPSNGQGAQQSLYTQSYPLLFNGSTFDESFTCPNTAVVNVTAGSTTEIVPLTASQVIRICSAAISMSAAGTAQFINGTGTNCGTSPQNITGAMPLATGTPLSVSSGTGSVFRTASGNALCVAAVTGNVTGFVTYAKY
jgi:hypothetical protein